jgi:hypothetical protein
MNITRMNFRTSKNSQTFRSNLQLFTDDDATPPDETLTDTERQAAEDAQDIQDMLDFINTEKLIQWPSSQIRLPRDETSTD